VHLFPVPREVITFFPYYRAYSYFVVGDEIIIVDHNHRIIAIINV